MKLIRNTASFKTFNYVVGYEKNYLIEALKTNQIPNPEKYCDKIFINEFYLLPILTNEIEEYLKENLKRILKNDVSNFDGTFERYSMFSRWGGGNIFKSIHNLRDAKRFLNEIFISVRNVKDEVDLGDFIIIKLLKFCYNDVYFLIYSNRNKFIANDDNLGYRHNGGVRRISLKKDDKNCSYDFSESILKKYLEEKKLYDDIQLENLRVLFQVLFLERSKEPLAFGFNHNFYKYFNDEIDDSEIPVKEYQKVLNSNWNTIIESIKKWQVQGKLFGLSAHLYHTYIRDFDTKDKFENYLRLLFYLGALEEKERNLNFHLDFDYVDRCISNYESRISKKFYGGNVQEYRVFLLSLFYYAKFPYIFETRICKYLYKGVYDSEDDALTKQDIKDFVVYEFRNFIEVMEYDNNNFFDLFNRSTLLENYQQEIGSNVWYERELILPEIKELSKLVITRFPDQFLTDILDDGGRKKYSKDNQKQIIGINSFVLKIFPSYDDFIEFIRTEVNDQSSVFKNEFLEFADKLPTKDDFISYDFTYLPIKNKLIEIWTKRSEIYP
ncbi:KAP-like P-loop domain-containing protein [Chryseobacterium geocarposphaerae]|uniref:KAP-like P-loop domain-containing protein n=1 Tax=Chryseobacterium geocarposphaerae TaxID=1416776 RepID=A0A2M9C2C8_9FLAO|nr:KAP family NTPase [Chryseobacterium geocarposphaerae]PJJ64591.1 KAP-like P-loop domain-containing protein [Chryseobacterium geocarposphaerae]